MAKNKKHKDNLVAPWQPGQSGNPQGRPKKSFTQFAEAMKAQGFTRVRLIDYVEAMEYLLGMDEQQLKLVGLDKSTPMAIRVCIAQLLSKKGFEAIETILDRTHGKPKQVTEIGGKLDQEVTIKFVMNDDE